jgi:hypothetical protein
MVETLNSIREVVAATRGGALTFKTADVSFSSVITGAEVVEDDLPYRRMSAFSSFIEASMCDRSDIQFFAVTGLNECHHRGDYLYGNLF